MLVCESDFILTSTLFRMQRPKNFSNVGYQLAAGRLVILMITQRTQMLTLLRRKMIERMGLYSN